ncbi:hypothetical protein JM83_1938 [Gillisia sp. Hel_I_86]|uniref:hypothetical protein n=1 Tax=Gillisia sp. Hel_I_86 TaxID=1249981 RepID=UPI00119B345B|nr:hypothetical protein [Gillisia sp. Hel_I_86]TVZ26935.1 hypothetical protein JM83_1938 [Gillisia sp. Hel_I_86]
MKKFEVYKNIRKQAVIFGLPISLFALMMASILPSLLIIIFSFSFGMIIGILIFNAALYIGLVQENVENRIDQKQSTAQIKECSYQVVGIILITNKYQSSTIFKKKAYFEIRCIP